MLCCVVLSCVVLSCVVLCCVVLRCFVLHFVAFFLKKPFFLILMCSFFLEYEYSVSDDFN